MAALKVCITFETSCCTSTIIFYFFFLDIACNAQCGQYLERLCGGLEGLDHVGVGELQGEHPLHVVTLHTLGLVARVARLAAGPEQGAIVRDPLWLSPQQGLLLSPVL